MNQQKLIDTFPDLAQHMQDDGYPYSYIRRLKTEVNWIAKNGIQKNIRSYEDACQQRENGTQSNEMKRWYQLAYGVLKRFEVYGQYPDGRRKESLVT